MMSAMSETLTRSHLRESVALEVRILLLRRSMTAGKLAAAIGKSEMYVSRRLRGETAFDLDDLQAIADTFHVSPVDLLPGRKVTEGYDVSPARRQSRKHTEHKRPVTTRKQRPPARKDPARPQILRTAFSQRSLAV